jgi:hypothetical protein
MTIDIKRECGGGVTQIALKCLDVVAVTDRNDSILMPIGYNREQSEKPCNFNGLTTPKYSFSRDI